MYSTYSFLLQLQLRKKGLLKLSESQRTRLFHFIEQYFTGRSLVKASAKKSMLRKQQLNLLSVKVFRSTVRITVDCVGLPLSIYNGKVWHSILVKSDIVGFPLSFFL